MVRFRQKTAVQRTNALIQTVLAPHINFRGFCDDTALTAHHVWICRQPHACTFLAQHH